MGSKDKNGILTVPIAKPNGDQTLSTMKSETLKSGHQLKMFKNECGSDPDDTKVRDTLDPEERQNKLSTEQLLSNSLKVDATILGLTKDDMRRPMSVNNTITSSEAPYNLNLEKYDSLFIDDEMLQTMSS